ncbi:MAG: hypothetical protein AVDCRST_MAG55-2809 [uncultured Rubrobacteraceae bacterium]|uniref:Uncharacterized protein n=1 Tax=uncultured Rubrobacteraceae bacterium TaxID=349277 RepID=A0A6J4Q359_9ACTN|nr:MAG: hypothetical protein AVDCRST_MAG55-2809 [uncultured Rubrobacteraceae bacterium]
MPAYSAVIGTCPSRPNDHAGHDDGGRRRRVDEAEFVK